MKTNNEGKHTPTPWKSVDRYNKLYGIVYDIKNDDIVIAQNLSREYADLIVRAVNSHEIMLNALVLAKKLAQADYDHAIESKASKIVTDAAFEALRTFKEAIAQADGKI